jgi:peroxiredoxin
MPLRTGAPVPPSVADAVVLDATGASVRVGTLWARSARLLVLLRHFGCVGCSRQVTELAPHVGVLARARVRTALVGNGSPAQLAAFLERHALTGDAVDAFTDPSLALYAAVGLRRSVWSTVGPRGLLDMARALGAGHPHRSVEGDATQQGGTVLVDTGGIVRLVHVNRSLGDHASVPELLDAALRLEIESSDAAARV